MKKLTVLILVVFGLFSCEKSDDPVDIPVNLAGTWELKEVSCFCLFEEDYDYTVHKITFNTSDTVATIEGNDDNYFIAKPGSYSYDIQEDKILFESNRNYFYEIKGDSLELVFEDKEEIADDEISLLYTKQ